MMASFLAVSRGWEASFVAYFIHVGLALAAVSMACMPQEVRNG